MQEIYNAAWYASQETTSWPFSYTPISKEGSYLPDSIISDIKIISRGSVPFYITGVQVTDSFVSVIVSSTSGIVAACTVQQPVKPYKHYPLETFINNIVGTIVFGSGANINYGVWQFTDNYTLNPSSVVILPAFPVLSIGKTSKLSGDVTLEAGSDLIIEKVSVDLGNRIEDGNVIYPDNLGTGYKLSLSTSAELRSTTVTTQQELLKEYAGPCTMRPTNKDCPYIVSINGVIPDSNGNITIKSDPEDTSMKAITVATKGVYSYSEEISCKKSPNESVFVLIGDSDSMDNPYIKGTFRRCGTDMCEVADESGTQGSFPEPIVVNDGITQGIALNTITGLIETATGIKGKAAVMFTEEPLPYVAAVFRYYYYTSAGAPSFGIIYNIKNAESGLETYSIFKFSDGVLSLGDESINVDISYGTNIMLCLTYSEPFFIGELACMDNTGNYKKICCVMHIEENTGGMGIYIENCRCQSWSEVNE